MNKPITIATLPSPRTVANAATDRRMERALRDWFYAPPGAPQPLIRIPTSLVVLIALIGWNNA
jgi:hypothetical protein